MKHELHKSVKSLADLRIGQPVYQELINHGSSEEDLDDFILGGCVKSVNAKFDRTEFLSSLKEILDAGGIIAGGFASRRFFNKLDSSRDRDVDIFLNDRISWMQYVIKTRYIAGIDVCLYFDSPWEFFDIEASCCSIDAFGTLRSSDGAKAARDTGVCSIIPYNIINPSATAKRIVKYNDKYGLRFKTEQVLAMCSVFDIPSDVSLRALKTCI